MDADVMAFSSALGYPSEQLQLVSGELQQLTDRLNIDQANLEDKLAGLESQFAQVHGTFQQLASPMSGIPVELKYAVLYYPVILATVFASFVGRYVLDRARARQLVPLVRRLGVSTEALDVYLADYSIRSNRQGNVAGPSIVPAFVLAVIVPGVLFAVSVAWIVSSQVFVEDRGWYVGLYVLAAAMMAGGYWALIGERLWQTIRRSSIRRNGDTA